MPSKSKVPLGSVLTEVRSPTTDQVNMLDGPSVEFKATGANLPADGFGFVKPLAIAKRGVLLFMLPVFATSVAHSQASFQGLGLLPDATRSHAYSVSDDGATVVGFCFPNRGFRWTSGSGMQDLGALPGSTESFAYGISGDGLTIVGTSYPSGARAVRWPSGGGLQNLGLLSGGSGSEAYDSSADGSTVVGTSVSSSGNRAFLWTSAGGMQSLGVLTGGTTSFANSVSADGSTVVGGSGSPSGLRAYRWTSAEGMLNLGVLPGGTFSGAYGVSGDGLTVVGWSNSSSGTRAYRWTSLLGMQSLGVPLGWINTTADNISGDGSTIVGSGNSGSGTRAFLWRQDIGMADLRSQLVEAGLSTELTGWTLDAARGVTTSNGKIFVVGWGTVNAQRQAFLAAFPIPEPISGAVALQDWTASPASQTVQFEITTSGGGPVLQAEDVALDGAGNYAFATSLPPGDYDIYAKGTHWLRRFQAITLTGSGVSGADFSLVNGDIDGDNEVGIGDFALLSSAYGSDVGSPNWNALADLNGDEEVSIGDYSILSANYGLIGE